MDRTSEVGGDHFRVTTDEMANFLLCDRVRDLRSFLLASENV